MLAGQKTALAKKKNRACKPSLIEHLQLHLATGRHHQVVNLRLSEPEPTSLATNLLIGLGGVIVSVLAFASGLQ